MMRCVLKDIPGSDSGGCLDSRGPDLVGGFRAGRTGKLAFHVFQVLVCVTG